MVDARDSLEGRRACPLLSAVYLDLPASDVWVSDVCGICLDVYVNVIVGIMGGSAVARRPARRHRCPSRGYRGWYRGSAVLDGTPC